MEDWGVWAHVYSRRLALALLSRHWLARCHYISELNTVDQRTLGCDIGSVLAGSFRSWCRRLPGVCILVLHCPNLNIPLHADRLRYLRL